jgi:hypothetical protein
LPQNDYKLFSQLILKAIIKHFSIILLAYLATINNK